jgi:hypothetical protein
MKSRDMSTFKKGDTFKFNSGSIGVFSHKFSNNYGIFFYRKAKWGGGYKWEIGGGFLKEIKRQIKPIPIDFYDGTDEVTIEEENKGNCVIFTREVPKFICTFPDQNGFPTSNETLGYTEQFVLVKVENDYLLYHKPDGKLIGKYKSFKRAKASVKSYPRTNVCERFKNGLPCMLKGD